MSGFAGIEKNVKVGTKYFIYQDGERLDGEVIKTLDNGMAKVLWSDGIDTQEHVISIRERIDAINKSRGAK